MRIELVVNGKSSTVDVPSDASLLFLLRERLGLKGAKEACGRGECGACTVLVGGVPVMGCLTFAAQVRSAVTTVEGLEGEFHELREAFAELGGFQCGYCTPGQIVRAAALIRSGRIQSATYPEAFVRLEMSGNICRCTGYTPIVDAILKTAVPGWRPHPQRVAE